MNNTDTYIPQIRSKDLLGWSVSYDEYTDRLQLFMPNIFEYSKNSLINREFDDYKIVYIKSSNAPAVIEISNVYDKNKFINPSIDDKSIIISFVMETLNKNKVYGTAR